MNDYQLTTVLRGKNGRRRKVATDIYYNSFGVAGSPFYYRGWVRDNNARGIARQITDPTEIEKARQTVTLLQAWCNEFLKNLPRAVSKAKTK